MKKLYGWLSLVQHVSSDQRFLLQCTLRGHSECNLGCTSSGAINEELLSNKFFTRKQIKICDHAAKYLCIFYPNVWIWCDMTKGLRVLIWMHPRSKLIGWSHRKAAVNSHTCSHWWTNFHLFSRENFEQAALNIQTCVGLLHNIMILKCFFWGTIVYVYYLYCHCYYHHYFYHYNFYYCYHH